MGIVYKCDKCGEIFEWYSGVSLDANKRFDSNCIKLMFLEPDNPNTRTNKGYIGGDLHDSNEEWNPIIILCPECMKTFLNSLESFLEGGN